MREYASHTILNLRVGFLLALWRLRAKDSLDEVDYFPKLLLEVVFLHRLSTSCCSASSSLRGRLAPPFAYMLPARSARSVHVLYQLVLLVLADHVLDRSGTLSFAADEELALLLRDSFSVIVRSCFTLAQGVKRRAELTETKENEMGWDS